MNEAGVLGRFIPDFGRIVAMMQFNMYHHYTVDEHLIRSIGVLTEIEAGQLGSEHPLANQIFRDHPQPPRALRRRLPARHRQGPAGGPFDGRRRHRPQARAALRPRPRRRPRRWPGSCEHHLLMSNTAQSRDLSDPATIKSFAEVVQTMERLKLLLVLTIADIKAVGPGVWTGWKGQLLRNLYHETEVVLGGGAADLARSERVRLAQEQLRAELPDWTDAEFEAYAARHTPGLLAQDRRDPPGQAGPASCGRRRRPGARSPTTYETDQFRGVTELTILSPDHPRLLAIITGACAAAGGNIVDAQIFTTTDGMALDTIVLSRAFDRDEDELRRAERVAKAIERALKGEVKIADLVDGKRPAKERSKAFHVPPEVDHRQLPVEPPDRDRGVRARPAGPALRPHDGARQAQPQHRLGPYRHLRREGGGRVLRDRPDGHESHPCGPPGHHPPDPARGVQGGGNRACSSAAALDLWRLGPDMCRNLSHPISVDRR